MNRTGSDPKPYQPPATVDVKKSIWSWPILFAVFLVLGVGTLLLAALLLAPVPQSGVTPGTVEYISDFGGDRGYIVTVPEENDATSVRSATRVENYEVRVPDFSQTEAVYVVP